MKAIISMHHGLKIVIDNARVAHIKQLHGETVMISNEAANFVLFRGVKGYYLKSPRLFRKSVPVKFVYA